MCVNYAATQCEHFEEYIILYTIGPTHLIWVHSNDKFCFIDDVPVLYHEIIIEKSLVEYHRLQVALCLEEPGVQFSSVQFSWDKMS